MTSIEDDDLRAVLQLAYPQGHALLFHEGGAGVLRIGAREVLTNALVAQDTLDARGLRALGLVLLAIGQGHVKVAERMLQLAEEKAGGKSAPPKACSPTCNTERSQ
ncbi:MAG TPA: hypothetical protein VN524_14265 [Hyphomicrobiaceae bacterium]|jgi:hypothetical protein|nr:hypothetical protein [Hyphomicrobiaceae bacterium]